MNSRLEEAEEWISDLEDKVVETNEVEKKRERGKENLFQEIIAENVCNLGKETDIQIQEAQRTPIKINKSRPTPRYIVINFAECSGKKS